MKRTAVTREKVKPRETPLSWAGIARHTAIALEKLPNGPTHISGGLLTLDRGPPTESKWPPAGYPHSDQALERLRLIAQHINDHFLNSTTSDYRTEDGKAGISAYGRLRWIIDRGYATADMRRELPIDIAEIARTASAANRLKAKPGTPRPRQPNELMLAKQRAQEQNPNYTWKQLLNHLKDRAGVVTEWDDTFVWWEKKNGAEAKTKTSTFQKWKSPR